MLEENGFSPKATIFCQPHDVILAVDRSSLIVIASKGTSTEVSSTDRYFDFSSRGSIDPVDLMKSARRDLGWENITYLKFNRDLLEVPDELREEEFVRVSQSMVEDIRKKKTVTEILGVFDVLTHIEKAENRFSAKDASGVKECIENCRNAVLLLIPSLTGKEGFEEGLNELKEEGILGESQIKIIKSIREFVAGLSPSLQASSDLPQATEEDAQFAIRLAEALVDYVVTIASRKKRS